MAEEGCDGILVLATEPVARAPGHDVDRIAHVEEETGCRVDASAVRLVGEPCLGQRPEHRHVAQPTVGLLQVRLDGLGQLTVTLVPGRDRVEELGKATSRVTSPVVGHGRPGCRDEFGIAGQRGEVQQSDGCGEVGRRNLAALGDGAHAVVQAHPGIPDGIPDAVRERGELLGRE